VNRLRIALALLAVAAHAQTWTPLFDGKTLNGWRVLGGESKFEVRDGTILGTSVPNAQHTFLATERTYGDFILEYEFQIDPDLNSGIQIRSHSDPAYQGGKVYGMQVEIDGDTRTKRFWSGGVFDQTRRGWLADLTQNDAARQAFKPGEWNRTRVEAIGDSIKTWINGVAASDLVDSVDLEGFLALQVHQNRRDTPMHVSFRNLRIQDRGRHTWAPLVKPTTMAGNGPTRRATVGPQGDFTLLLEYRLTAGSAVLSFRGLRLALDTGDVTGPAGLMAHCEPQKGVKPITSGDWKQVTVSFHNGRLVIHTDGVRTVDVRDAASSRAAVALDLSGDANARMEVRRFDLLSSTH